MKKQLVIVGSLAALVFVSAVGLVYVQHVRRALFVELQVLERSRDKLQMEWGQLELEKSTWATHDRINMLARQRLKLEAPSAAEIVVVTQ